MTLTKRIATPRPTAVLLTGGQKAFGLLPLAMVAAEAASANAATAPSCLGVPGTNTVIVPAGTKAPYSLSPSKPVVVDLRAVTLTVNPPDGDGIAINNAPGGTCISGGEVVGQQSRDLGWDDVKHGGAGRYAHDGVHWSHPSPGLVTVENSHIVNVEDAIGPPKDAATDIGASLLVRGVHAEYIRDDFLENDACLPGEVADVLVDGTHMFVSERPSGSAQCVADRPKDLHIHDSVVWLSCQPDMRGSKNKSSCPNTPGGLRQSAGEVFKWRAGSGRVLMERVVVRIDGTPVGGAGSMAWPAGTYQSVTVVWLGPGPYPAPVPPGVTVTTSLALWLNARAAWLQRHRGTGGTSGSGGSGDREVEQARDACRQIGENRGWRDVRLDVRARDEDRGRVVVDVRGRRGGDEREHRCTYAVRDRYAAFDDQYGERAVDRAKEACRDLAEDRGWREVRLEMRDRGRDGPIVMDVHGRRDGDERERECTYRPREDRAALEGGDEGRGDDRREVEQARDACRRIAEDRGWRDVDTDVRDRGRDRDRGGVTGRGRRDGGDRERECRYDVRRGDAEFDDRG